MQIYVISTNEGLNRYAIGAGALKNMIDELSETTDMVLKISMMPIEIVEYENIAGAENANHEVIVAKCACDNEHDENEPEYYSWASGIMMPVTAGRTLAQEKRWFEASKMALVDFVNNPGQPDEVTILKAVTSLLLQENKG